MRASASEFTRGFAYPARAMQMRRDQRGAPPSRSDIDRSIARAAKMIPGRRESNPGRVGGSGTIRD